MARESMRKRKERMKDRLILHHDPQDRPVITRAVLWRIQGEEFVVIENEPHDRAITFYALTDDPWKLPDPHAAYASVSQGRGTLTHIYCVEHVAEGREDLASDSKSDYAVRYCECANQTGTPIEPDISAMVASLIWQLKKTKDEYDWKLKYIEGQLGQAKHQLDGLKKNSPDNHCQRSELYRGVLIAWDDDRDERIRTFVDSLPDIIRGRLLMANEHQAMLSLIWAGSDAPPEGYKDSDNICVDDDVWYIGKTIVIKNSHSEYCWANSERSIK